MDALKIALGDDFVINGQKIRPGPKHKFTDLQVVVLSLTAECLSIDSENLLFQRLNTAPENIFPNLLSRRQYHDRRKMLSKEIAWIFKRLGNILNDLKEVFAVDAMPLRICRKARRFRNKVGIDRDETKPDMGFCAAQDEYYFGYKLHATCSPQGVIQTFDITAASVHDSNFLNDIRYDFKDCIIVGDKGYICKYHKELLWKRSKVCLETPSRENQKDGKNLQYELRVVRKKIETVFSQLEDHFMIQRNYAKTFLGYSTRIISKITGMTILNFINMLNGKPKSQIKYALL